jgi:ubiquinone/menaquinone biosynthesis C-methylase UbiE
LDLGCGIGDQAAELIARGARVIGVDANEALLDVARSKQLETAEFRAGDLIQLPDIGVLADGVWSSFASAYLPDFSPVLSSWKRHLKPQGWIALIEIDDLFGHDPLSSETKSLLDGYARQALAARRYDFHMGRKLRAHLERAGFDVSDELTLEDRELSFQGRADPDVVDAWRSRFERMKPLKDFCGASFESARDDFLFCLTRADHRAAAKVCCCIARVRAE